jgi:flagellar hook-associated protein 1 FlgK
MLTVTQTPGPVSAAEPSYPQLAIAAGFTPDQVAAAGSANSPADGSNAQLAAELGNSTTGADAQYRTFISGLGTDVQRAGSQLGTAQAVASQNTAALQGQEGVNTDEEMANMVAFQNAYTAAARVLTTIDSTLDTLINHTGLTT